MCFGKNLKKFFRNTFVTIITITLFYASPSDGMIRDAEVEGVLTEMVQSVFSVAGIRPETARVYVINDDSINAFTVGNGFVFINSGLILQFNNPVHLVAVLCHETAHIAAGHINKMVNTISSAYNRSVLAMLAATAGMILTKSPEIAGLFTGYSMYEERKLMKFSREQESQADALAASYLAKLDFDASALIEVFEKFQHLENISGDGNVPIYARSHPYSKTRILYISKYVKKKYQIPNELQKKYDRIRLKLKSYLKSNTWPPKIPKDAYMKAIYFQKNGKIADAIKIMQDLIRQDPSYIYYKDTLAQMLYESGDIEKAIKIYSEIYSENLPPLIQIDYAIALIEASKQPDSRLDLAIKMLETAKYKEDFNPEVYRLLARAYGKKGRDGIVFFMLGNEQLLLGNYQAAVDILERSIKKLDPKSEKSYVEKAKYLKQLIKRDYKRFL